MTVKRWPAIVAAASLLSAGIVTPAAAAEDPAPTEVTIGWADATKQKIRVTWKDSGSTPNLVFLQRPGKTEQLFKNEVPADGPDQIDLSAGIVQQYSGDQYDLQIGVAVGTKVGGLTSPVGLSEDFDTMGPGEPVRLSTTPTGSDTLLVRWRSAVQRVDVNPGDPFDSSDPPLFQPVYDKGAGPVQIKPWSSQTEVTFSGVKPPYQFHVNAKSSDWPAQRYGATFDVMTAGLTTKIPTWVLFGHATIITGTVADTAAARPVVLQARNSPTSPWYVVSTQSVRLTYRFQVPAPGTREYRVVVPNASGGLGVSYGATSAAVKTTTQNYIRHAEVATTPVTRSYYADFELYVDPRATFTAHLQRWNGKAWVAVGNIALRQGYGQYVFRTTTPGRFVYRFYVPATKSNGLPTAATYTNNLVLTVR
jgi:hypothetical protein